MSLSSFGHMRSVKPSVASDYTDGNGAASVLPSWYASSLAWLSKPHGFTPLHLSLYGRLEPIEGSRRTIHTRQPASYCKENAIVSFDLFLFQAGSRMPEGERQWTSSISARYPYSLMSSTGTCMFPHFVAMVASWHWVRFSGSRAPDFITLHQLC